MTRPFLPALLTATALGLQACSASAQDEADRPDDSETSVASMECAVQQDLSDIETTRQWGAVNDGVMGGRSSGGPSMGDGFMIFSGSINTNGGGFSSIRTRMQPGQLAGADGLRLKIRTDGRDYKMTFRTSERWRGRSVSYQAPIPNPPEGEWGEVFVSFDDLDTSVFGRRVQADAFDPSDVREMGIILADGQDGPFRFDMERLGCVSDAPVET